MASEKITAIVESVKTMTVLELKELVDTICEEFGVSAVAAAAPAAAGAAAPAEEEKTEFDVILAEAGATKMQVIKAVKEITGLGLKEAKAIVDGAPKAVKGTSLEGLAEQFKGDTAIAFAHEADPMSAARILCKYQDGDKSKKFVVKAGFMEGKAMNAAETNAIAKLPNREGMLSMFAGALTSTLSGLAVAMQAYADKQEEPAA